MTIGLGHSMLVKAQRRELDEIGRGAGTPVVYLKSAWADPVLYGGRGERTGGDIDVLVRPTATVAFARELEGRGFVRYMPRWLWASTHFGNHAWLYLAPAGRIPVDLHLGLATLPWFEMPVEGCLERAQAYPSVDGPILSLSPEDQILFAALHYANHRYDLDQAHVQDVVRLLRGWTVDWPAVARRARRDGLRLPLALLLETLRHLGAAVPPAEDLGWVTGLRLSYTRRWVATTPELRRRRRAARVTDRLLRLPVLSDRPAALPRYIARHTLLRVLDLAAALWPPGASETPTGDSR